jgi:hypothetical protein
MNTQVRRDNDDLVVHRGRLTLWHGISRLPRGMWLQVVTEHRRAFTSRSAQKPIFQSGTVDRGHGVFKSMFRYIAVA